MQPTGSLVATAAAVVGALMGLAPNLGAQIPAAREGPAARMVVIRPKEGQQGAFEAGYRRHLEWHRTANDPWTWYGWTVVLGPRLGLFVDGTFGHDWIDFDRAVDPAGDAADNAANVTPYADFLSHAVYERLFGVDTAPAALPDTSPYLVLTTYRVAPGRGRDFEALVRRSRGSAPSARPDADDGATWYRAVVGTEGTEYLLLRRARGWVDLERRRDPLADASSEAGAIVRATTTELLRFRRDMSYAPSR